MLITEDHIRIIFNLDSNISFSEVSAKSYLKQRVDQLGFPYVVNLICSYFIEEDEDDVKDAIICYIKR